MVDPTGEFRMKTWGGRRVAAAERANLEQVHAEIERLRTVVEQLRADVQAFAAKLLEPAVIAVAPRRRSSRLKSAIVASGLTQREIARGIGISESRLSNVVHGRVSLTSHERRAMETLLAGSDAG